MQEVERSEGSRQKLLNPLAKEGSAAFHKFSSISLGQQKFSPEDLIVETIANSEKVCPPFTPLHLNVISLICSCC